MAFYELEGECIVDIMGKEEQDFNNCFEFDGVFFLEFMLQFFNFNNFYGVCFICEGFSKVMGIDEGKVVFD